MKRLAAIALCALSLGCAERKSVSTVWDAEATKAARGVLDQYMAALVRMDMDAIKAMTTEDVVAYDIDFDGKPVRMGSITDAMAYAEGLGAAAKKVGATLTFENTKVDCHATADLAYGLLEYDFVATMPDGSRMVQPTRTSVVLTKSNGAWRWAHWHSSLAAPSTPATR